MDEVRAPCRLLRAERRERVPFAAVGGPHAQHATDPNAANRLHVCARRQKRCNGPETRAQFSTLAKLRVSQPQRRPFTTAQAADVKSHGSPPSASTDLATAFPEPPGQTWVTQTHAHVFAILVRACMRGCIGAMRTRARAKECLRQ